MDVTVNWLKLVQLQVPMQLRRKRMVVWLLVLISGVRGLYNAFLDYRKASLYSLRITGQTIYLEKALNDRFDFIERGIYIETAEPGVAFYLHNQVELAPKVYMYNQYKASHSYLVGEFAVHAGRRWKAIVPNPVLAPGMDPAEWIDMGPRMFVRNKAEGLVSQDFIIWVPTSVLVNASEMRALVDRYKLAGKRYLIMTY